MCRWIAAGAAALLSALPAGAGAQLFSPGKLSPPHESLEGLSNCKKCHVAGDEVSQALCLTCHEELAERVEKGAGFHGRMKAEERACERCHHEHQGRDRPLIEWTPKTFDHRKTGWILEGAHARVDCDRCHERSTTKRTYLGARTRCASCHFDQHRGQEGDDCARCHDSVDWKNARRFEHSTAAFPLRGAHARVDCEKCHRTERDERAPIGASPAFLRLKPVAHGACTDCHADPHAGRFSAECSRCHSEDDWHRVKEGATSAPTFHDRTRYPLAGAHRGVACKACHWPIGQGRQVFKGLRFAKCADCHLDAHRGQVGTECESCHDVEGFTPPIFDEAMHARAGWALEGAHLAVACSSCHEKSDALAPERPPSLQRALTRRGRSPPFSLASFAVPEETGCSACHVDPHAGQFAAKLAERGCEACHRASDFSDLSFDHDRDSTFPLTGAHRRARCGSCHRAGGEGAVIYRPLDAACTACHVDPHAGQLGDACDRCHDTAAFASSSFTAETHDRTRFPLGGRHRALACEKCHEKIAAGGTQLRRYVSLPLDCAGCHRDFHDGGFAPLAPRAGGGTDCSRCHTLSTWTGAPFAHDSTGFPLAGAHRSAACRSCHPASFEVSISSECAGCHRDVHRGELGFQCRGCHDEHSWKSRFAADEHRASAFPLSGAHAVVPCEECHAEAPARGFSRARADCVRCHETDYREAAVTSMDHVAAGFDTTCQTCHTPWQFSRARWEPHEACFQISRGEHANIRCRDCHETLIGLRPDGTCSTNTAACTSCHEHRCEETNTRHTEVPGYQCKDRKCYECHRFSER